MFVCMCTAIVCMCIHMYTCVYMYIYVYICAYMYICIYVYICIFIYSDLLVYVIFKCLICDICKLYANENMYLCIYILCVFLYVDVRVCMCVI